MFGKVVGGIMGTVAFSVACIVGLLAGNDATTVLSRGLMAMLIFFAVGFVIGLMARRMIDEHMNRIIDADREEQTAPAVDPADETAPVNEEPTQANDATAA